MFVSEAIVSGEKTPYAAGVTFMRGLMNRYLTFRNSLENEAIRKIFRHLARKRGYYLPTPAEVNHRVKTRRDESKLALPKFFWHKANLLANQQIQQMVINLRDKGEIPFRIVAEMFGWDVNDIVQELKQEEGSRVDQTWRKVRD